MHVSNEIWELVLDNRMLYIKQEIQNILTWLLISSSSREQENLNFVWGQIYVSVSYFII